MAKKKATTKKAAKAALAPHADGAPAIDIGINAKERARIADGLSHFLADSYTLYLKTHNFHWNVTGSMFNALHTICLLYTSRCV